MPQALAIAPSQDQISILQKQGYIVTVWTLLPCGLHDADIQLFDIRKPWGFSKVFDYITCSLWPQEELAQIEILRRMRKILHDGGKVEITRPNFTHTYCYEDLPIGEPRNNWLLTTSLKAVPNVPKIQQLIITNLQDKYPQQERFLTAIIDSLNKISDLDFSYTTTESPTEIKLSATDKSLYQIKMELNRDQQIFKVTLTPAHSKIFPVLARLCSGTFTNDIISSSNTYTADSWIMTVTAKS